MGLARRRGEHDLRAEQRGGARLERRPQLGAQHGGGEVLGGDAHLRARPAFADLDQERAGEVVREAHRTERRELDREQALRLHAVEAIEGGEDLVEPTGRLLRRLGGPELEILDVEPRHVADPVPGVDHRLHQPEPLEIRGAIAAGSPGGAQRLHDAVAPLPCPQQVGGQAGEPRDGAEGVGELDGLGSAFRHGRERSRSTRGCIDQTRTSGSGRRPGHEASCSGSAAITQFFPADFAS